MSKNKFFSPNYVKFAIHELYSNVINLIQYIETKIWWFRICMSLLYKFEMKHLTKFFTLILDWNCFKISLKHKTNYQHYFKFLFSWFSGGFSRNTTTQDLFDWPDWFSMDLSLFLREGLRTAFGYKKRKLSSSPKFSYKIFWANICSRLHSRFGIMNSTKVSQKPLIFWFENYSAKLKCTGTDYIRAMQRRFRTLSNI